MAVGHIPAVACVISNIATGRIHFEMQIPFIPCRVIINCITMSNVHHDQGQRRAWFAALAYNLIPFNVAADWYLCPVCARESAIDFLSFIRTTFHAHHPIRWSSTFGHYPSRPDDSFFSGRALLVARLTIFFGWSEPQRWLMDGFPCVDDQSILHGRKYHNRNGVKCRCRYSIIEIGEVNSCKFGSYNGNSFVQRPH